MKAYLSALEREQEAWRALDGRLPGMSGCSPALWADWMDAVARLNAEAARCMETRELASSSTQRHGGQRGSGPART